MAAAVDASDAERLRIARDLHDGVVQDLAGAAFAVSAAARDDTLPTSARAGLADAGDSMRTSLRALRSLRHRTRSCVARLFDATAWP